MSSLRFVIVPKVVHPWFEEVHLGALAQAAMFKAQLGIEIAIDYLPPSTASAVEQIHMLEKCMATKPDGIALDPVEAISNMPRINHIRNQGIPIILFDSPSPARIQEEQRQAPVGWREKLQQLWSTQQMAPVAFVFVLLLALFVSGTIVSVSQKALPGDSLYSVKHVLEQLALATSFDRRMTQLYRSALSMSAWKRLRL